MVKVKQDKQAVRPNTFLNIPSLIEDKKAEQKGATEEERQYYAMSMTVGWKKWREFLENLINDLEEVNKQAIANGMSYEEIGRNTIVTSTVKDIIKKGLNKVDDAVEACTND